MTDMTAMAADTAIPAAMALSGMRCAMAMPVNADSVLPPMIDQGWASGLAGTAKSSTAEAPRGATSKGR